MRIRQFIRGVLRPVALAFAIIYFIIDALFLVLLKPLATVISRLAVFERFEAWVETLGPYPTLALFIIPVAIFEPVKPVGAYLIAEGHVVFGIIFIAVGEVLKIVILERLFHICRDKLMTIKAFAIGYTFITNWLDYFKAFPVYQAVADRAHQLKQWAREMAATIRTYFR